MEAMKMDWSAPVETRDGVVEVAKAADPNLDALLWSDELFSVGSSTGIRVSQASALQSTAVFACVNRLSVDVGKLGAFLYKENPDGSMKKLRLGDSGLSPMVDAVLRLLRRPNDWQTWFEFVVQMQAGLVMRGNAYAVIVQDVRGYPKYLVPINPDKVTLWEAPNGDIFYMVTRTGLHQMAVLEDVELLVPYDQMLHLKSLSSNGLLGVSPITLCREAIGLSLAQEQLASRWMGNGARPSGILSTPNKLTEDAARRMAEDWKAAHGGLQNSGRTAVFEQGLTWVPLSMKSTDLEFIASRKMQLQEIARIFDVPLHMLADPEVSSSKNARSAELAQQYLNQTISTYTEMWRQRWLITFDLDLEGVDIGFDYGILTRSDISARYENYRKGIMGSFLTPNEARLDDGRLPLPEGDKLIFPGNSTPFGSDKAGNAPDGAGKPAGSGPTSDQMGKD